MKHEVQAELQGAYRAFAEERGQRNRNIRLPSALDIRTTSDGMRLKVNAKAVQSNMQTDDAAVESWALVLRLWLGEKRVPRVVADWDVPGATNNGHYERFLYRVAQFRSLFPWFDVACPERVAASRALTERNPVLNVASGKGTPEPKTKSAEYKLEAALIESPEFKSFFSLERVDRQFPVGLFSGEVDDKHRIFTGGKSAIDIVGVAKDRRFFLYELKAKDNIKVGILSELLLYTALIREAARSRPRITFKEIKASSRACIHPGDVRECTGIEAVMLVEELHPLLEHPDLIPTLNGAASLRWNREADAKPVCFSLARVASGPVLRTFEKRAEAIA